MTVWGTTAKAVSLIEARLRRRWLSLIPLTIVNAGLESLGTLLVFALLRLVVEPSAIADVPILGRLRAFYTDFTDAEILTGFALLVAAFYLVKNLARFIETYFRQACAGTTSVLMSARLLERYLAAPYTFHLRHNSGDLVRNTHGAVNTVFRDFMNSAVTAVSEFLVVLGVTAALVISAPGATLAGSAMLAIFAVLFLRVMQTRFGRWGRTQHHLTGVIQRRLQESFQGIKEIKVLGRESYFAELYAQPAAALARIRVLNGSLQVLPRLIVETVFVLGVVGAIVLMLGDAEANNDLLPLLGLFAYALMRLLPSVHLIVYHVNNCRFCGAAVDQVHRDWVALAPRKVDRDPAASPRRKLRREITFEAVSFSYPDTERTALTDIDLTIRRGESIGVVGPTGAGKSTLVDLLMGLLPPDAGRVLVDGEDLAADPEGWRRQIGYVPQHIYLIDDTLRRNVALGEDDSQIDDRRIEMAIRVAQLRDMVAELPEGLDTVVGEAGSRLSGGERQRVAIARALYRDPEILVFDEATSALDNRSAAAVAEAIGTLEGRKTMVIIAHSALTIRRCDRLVFMQNGRVTDVGSPEELSARNPEFRTTFGLSAAS